MYKKFFARCTGATNAMMSHPCDEWPFTCSDTKPLGNSGQSAVILLAGKDLQAMLLCPFLPHMLRRCKAGAPVDARAASQCGSSQNINACRGDM